MSKSNVELKLAAREAGLRHYDPGVPCKRGHISKRYASTGQCVECQSGKTDRPLDDAQQMMVDRYRIAFLIPKLSPDMMLELDTFMVRCADHFIRTEAKLLPVSLMNAQEMAKGTGKPVREYL